MTETITKGKLFVSPAEFFCGDTVILSYDFTVSDIAAMEVADLNGTVVKNPSQISKMMKPDNKVFKVKSIAFSTDRNKINMSMECVFWETGPVKLPLLTVTTENQTLEINIPKITVSSIIEKTKVTSLQEYKAPQIIPGTTYIIYGGIFLSLLFIAGIIFAGIKMPRIRQFIREQKAKRKFRKNYKRSVLAVKNLSKDAESLSSEEYCMQLQSILRSYFAVRFSSEIYNLATGEIMNWFSRIYLEVLPENAETSVLLFYDTMFRCDFIRFSGTDEKDGGMQPGERESLARDCLKTFDLMEKDI